MEGMVGQPGEVRQALAPTGMVLAAGELWRAESEGEPIGVGERVVVIGHEGFRLRVRKM
jgi:membrane-bound ClpP family serine protease